MQDDEKYKKIKEALDRLHKQKQNSKENSKNNLNNQSNSQNNINQNSNNSDKNSNSNKNSNSSSLINKRDYDKKPLIIQSYEEFFVLTLFIISLVSCPILVAILEDLRNYGNVLHKEFVWFSLIPISYIIIIVFFKNLNSKIIKLNLLIITLNFMIMEN